MRNVAVTEGDKVEAQIIFGWEVDAYPVNEIVEAVNAVSQADIDTLVEEYYDKYEILPEGRDEKEFLSLKTKAPLLYGGSVNASNIASITQIPHCAGVLVGSASWQVQSFIELIRASKA